MPAKSKAQQAAMAIALHDPDKLYKRNRGILSMKLRDVRDFAATKHKGLPKKKKHNPSSHKSGKYYRDF